jgi:hypothetical protein
MTAFEFCHLSSFSILVPLSAVAWKWTGISKKYPFLVLLLIIGAFSDLTSYITIKVYGQNTLNGNIYLLLEFVLFGFLFKRWPSYRSSRFHLLILSAGVLVWVGDNLIVHTLFSNNSMSRLVCYVLLVSICIDQLVSTLLNRAGSVILSDILICLAFLFHYIYRAFIESFQLYTTHLEPSYFIRLWVIDNGLNILTNLMITVAFICHRHKPTYSILSSQA